MEKNSIYFVSNEFKVIKLDLADVKETIAEGKTSSSHGDEIGEDVQDFFVRQGVVFWLTFNGKVRTSDEKKFDLFRFNKGFTWYTLTLCGGNVVAAGFSPKEKTNVITLFGLDMNFLHTYTLDSSKNPSPIIQQKSFVFHELRWLVACRYLQFADLFIVVEGKRVQHVKCIEVCSSQFSISSVCFMQYGEIWFGGLKWISRITLQ